MIKRALVMGSDKRMYYCSEALREVGIESVLSDSIAFPANADIIILPPQVEPGILPLEQISGVKAVFVGKSDASVIEQYKENGIILSEYGKHERFLDENAVLTAEAATTVYIGASASSFVGAKVLIAGYGRIGKALASLLTAHGAEVTVSARKLSDIESIHRRGYSPIETCAIRGCYDVIFNTVPANVFTRDITDATKTDYYVELASPPYGTAEMSIWGARTKVIMAGGLPGKVLPVSAGKLIKETVCTISADLGI